MRCRVIPGRELTEALATEWSSIQASNPALANPYFCPGYTRAVAAIRNDVRVALVDGDHQPAAFFPFQLRGMGLAGPVGGPLSDYQGVIAPESADWDAVELVRAAGISAWDFDHLLCAQTPFKAHTSSTSESPVMDLSNGYDAYVAERRAAGSKVFRKLGTLRRKLEREVAPIRFELETIDESVLSRLFAWKSEQCRRTGTVDVFGVRWTKLLIRQLLRTRERDFGGALSGLWVGDELAAAHFGIRSRTQWHYWFPTYNHTFAAYSPGLLLLDEIACAAAARGIDTIDLGKGEAPYKERVRSRGVAIAEGSVELRSLAVGARSAWNHAAAWIRRTPLAGAARAPGRVLRRIAKRIRFR